MTDKEYFQDLLLTSKTLTEMYHFAVQESSTDELHYQFKDILNQSLELQHKIYALMQQKGWYSVQNADQAQINQVKSKFMN